MNKPSATPRRFRSQDWFDNPDHIDMTALYLERFMNYGITAEELRSGRPIIGIAQSGSDISPCNRIHLELAKRVRDGIRDAGGIPMEFPLHPIFENCRRPTAAIDRNLAYLGLVEILHGYPIDAVVLTTGCDKTTPSQIMAAATVDIPAIVLSGGPMLDGWLDGELVGSGAAIWKGRKQLSAGAIDNEKFLEIAAASAPSSGHCNTMGTASTMNAMAEALGMSLTGCSAIPAPYRERGQMAYETGRRIVGMAYEDLRPSAILTREAFLDAIVVNAAIGGSTNAQPHIMAMARHAGVDLQSEDWMKFGYDVPLLLNMQPAGKYLGERFHRAGGVPAIMWELQQAGKLRADRITATGKSMAENLQGRQSNDREVIYPFSAPLRERAGFLVLKGNLFDFAIMKTSVISETFRQRYLSTPGQENIFECRAVVFDGSDDYHARINDPALNIDDNTLLAIRGAGPVGWPGSAEVVNMQPPDALIKRGVSTLPTLGDGRQSGTSDSPSILNASPESAVGGGLAWLRDGDRVRIDLNTGECNMLISEEELARRKSEGIPPVPPSQTPWQEIYRSTVGQLETGACMELALKYQGVAQTMPRHNH
ncbi:dihydroxyacid dehydratase/phosphogluconate dehydratase [Herbaspirillum sp. BH-1]|uniref:Dihydroxyacid dehydratase/phosphogluconate dehydratase n=2 Tax=Herbaspirillum frisingense TaxID=92645 RepID=A0AAI9IBI4_9BURK|nr:MULTISPECIES: IlvD/Edd family dehydratase [Herbaspirillum]EOA03075.1 dihydroxyacid dehydratase/phosphogluconate dehydratase [Herbaspirillum frisingense GSF30]MCI1013355.1 dihydroxy-acid dehydratase family protein [Herbaspirillum sp. C7C2]MDR6582950.1 dihydroxy-acid dehydratase [Herbaspirillum frisingense]ONN67988.1 dihydroxy-acid dehydratase [Herbaspirillum sp. VT-16-41]PLY60470.1 dihydroxyacid dehydratase/phosphogluconate dehydratase [Herbaspirillum sp. BH-1]